jgi:hypothetical protein
MPIAKIYPQGFYRNLFHIFYLYFSFYAFLKFIHISKILKPEKEFEKKWEQYWAGFQPKASAQRGKPVDRPMPAAPRGHAHGR